MNNDNTYDPLTKFEAAMLGFAVTILLFADSIADFLAMATV